jgi:hypothetical protein
MSRIHPLLEGVETLCERHRMLPEPGNLFELLYNQIRTNWARNREADRWPTPEKNWVLRVAPEFTHDPTRRLEKQLQKQIAICLEDEDWGNDVPTASGLFNQYARQMNVDLAHRVTDGFELIELKLESNTPDEAALQILRYGAIYMLYRLEPELTRRFKLHEMMFAKRIVLEVLAPLQYYSGGDWDLGSLRKQEEIFNRQVETFAKHQGAGVALSFRFMAFPPDFIYQPGMACELIRDATRRRASPFRRVVQIKGYGGEQINSFTDWEKYALPAKRKELHWKEGRSACELGRHWTTDGEPCLPLGLVRLLDSHEVTRGAVVSGGITEHETALPFSNGGPRSHDLALRALRNESVMTICIEAKADESFGGTIVEELRKSQNRADRNGGKTRFPERLDWLTRSLLGISAFADDERLVLSHVISQLPYQLLSAIGGTLLEAQLQNATVAVFVVHVFRTSKTTDAKLQANEAALSGFLLLLQERNGGSDGDNLLHDGHLIGPISIIERPAIGGVRMPCHIPLFIGKITTEILA